MNFNIQFNMIHRSFVFRKYCTGKSFIFILVFLFVSSIAPAQKVWTLQECIEYALNNNITIKQTEISTEISDVNYLQNKAAFFPTLNSNGSYSYNFGRSVDPFTYNFSNSEIQSANISLSSNLNVFSGLQLQNSLSQSKYEYMAGKENLLKIKNDVALNVAAAYLQVLYSKESLKLANDRLESSKQTQIRTKLMVDAGSMAQGNLLDADAALAGEELNVINNENLLKSALIAVTQLLELKTTDGFTVADPSVDLPDQSALALSPDEIFNTSLKTLPEFRASELNIKVAEKGLSISKGARSPRLNLFGSIASGYSNAARNLTGGDVVFGDQLDNNFNKSFGLSLTIPLFNGWSAESNIKRARLNLENVRYTDQLTRNQAYKSIFQAHSDATAGLKKYYASEKAAIANKEALVYAQKKYDVGILSSIEFLNVKNATSKAESDFLQAKYDLIFRVKVIDFYLGKPLIF
ncbi:MAG: TolC family protein [Bacteroidetes bacterium]|nr:TolC family protein [Bacteroidota bacterium]